MDIININLEKIPTKPGIYIFKNKKKQILYIGKAKNLKNRIKQYFNPNSVRKQDMLNKSELLDFFVVENEIEALNLEENMIKEHKPLFNSLLKGNHRYIYIKILNEKFPRIIVTKHKYNDGAIYLGPKYNNKELRDFLSYFRQLLGYRTCGKTKFNQKKLCSDYYFDLCKGRCKFEGKEKYDKILKYIINFFDGNTKPVKKYLFNEINKFANENNFEYANKLKKMYEKIELFEKKLNTTLDIVFSGYLFKIFTIGNNFVYIILKFQKSMLVDIIVNDTQNENLDIKQLIYRIKIEFQSDNSHLKFVGINKGIISKQKYLKKEISDIFSQTNGLFQNFLDSYLISNIGKSTEIINIMLSKLQERYFLKNFPYKIECIDISHFNGENTVGGLSCFIGGIKYPKGYRKYKISIGNNDYKGIYEILKKRFIGKKNNELDLPDIFIIDGGKGQLQIVKKILKKYKEFEKIFQKVDFISLGKGIARNRKGKQIEHEKIYYFDKKLGIKQKKLEYDQIDRFFINIRDEAHKFANNYRKTKNTNFN